MEWNELTSFDHPEIPILYQLIVELGYWGAYEAWAETLTADGMRPNVHVDYFLDQLDKVLSDDKS
jgi:hypothetical protein